eukprot:5412121-Pleurochrysis_carterae.AAC.2
MARERAQFILLDTDSQRATCERQVDLNDASFWNDLELKLQAEGQPAPDLMHVIPPCNIVQPKTMSYRLKPYGTVLSIAFVHSLCKYVKIHR